MKTRLLSALMLVALLALVGCITSSEPTPEAAELHLKAEVNMDANGEVVLRFGAHNMGPADFPGDKDFVGKWELTDEADALRASGSLTLMGPLGSGKTTFPAEWKSELVPGAYTLTWSAANYDSIVVSFTIVERNGELSIGEQVTQPIDTHE
jgi:predicted NACHT family NTPase